MEDLPGKRQGWACYLPFLLVFLVVFTGLPVGHAIAPSSITCTIGRLAEFLLGDRIGVSGTIDPARIGADVSLTYVRPDGTRVLRRVPTSRSGGYLDIYTPDMPGSWKVSASWPGDSEYAPATSLPVLFTVSDLTPGTSRMTCYVNSSSVSVRTAVEIFGSLFPAHSAAITIQFAVRNETSWTDLVRQTTRSDGSYDLVWTWNSPEEYLLRASFSGDESYKGSVSDPVPVSVTAPLAPLGLARGETWTFMVYMAADNNLGSNPGGGQFDVYNQHQMELAGSTSSLNIIVLWDTAPTVSNPTKILYVAKGGSIVVKDYGTNLDTGNPMTLTNFITWTVANYPAQHYVLDLWGHGGGFKGVLPDDTSGNSLDMIELKASLAGAGMRFDVVGFDACLMAMAEVVYQMRNWADYVVASEETIPGTGWPYDAILADLASAGHTSGSFASTIVTHYATAYSTCTTCTIAAINTLQTANLANAVNAFGSALQNGLAAYRSQIANAYLTVEYYYDPSFIDLYDFARRVRQDSSILDSVIMSAADSVKSAVTSAVLIEWHSTGHVNSHGLTIYGEYRGAYYTTSYDGLDLSLDTAWNNFVRAYLGLPLLVTQITIAHSPPVYDLSLSIWVDGSWIVTPKIFTWAWGSTHTLTASSTVVIVGESYRWLFASWSDGGAQSHEIRTPSTPSTYTATFYLQVTTTETSTLYSYGTTTTTVTSYTSTSTSTSTIPTVTTVVLAPLTITSTAQSTQFLTSFLTTTATSYTSTTTSTSTIPTTVALVPLTMTSTDRSTQSLTSILTTTVTSYTGTETSTSTIVVPTTVVLVPSTITSAVQSTQLLTSILTTMVTSYTATTTSTSTSVVYTTVTKSGAGAAPSSSLAYLGFMSLLAVTVGHTATTANRRKIPSAITGGTEVSVRLKKNNGPDEHSSVLIDCVGLNRIL